MPKRKTGHHVLATSNHKEQSNRRNQLVTDKNDFNEFISDDTYLLSQNKEHLKAELRRRGLKTSGNKTELVGFYLFFLLYPVL